MELAGIAVNIRNEHPKGFPLEKKQTNITRMMIGQHQHHQKPRATRHRVWEKEKRRRG